MAVCNNQAWDEFVTASGDDVGFMQSSWWAEFMTRLGWGHFGATLQDGATIVAGAQVLVRHLEDNHCYYYIPEGPILPSDPEEAEQVFALILAFIDRKRQLDNRCVSHLRIESRWSCRPAFINGFESQRGWLEPRNTLYVDLGPAEDQILAQMKPKGRYNVRLAARHGVRIVADCSAHGIADFLQLYEQTESRHGLQGKPRTYFKALFATILQAGRGSLYFAEYKGERLATALVIFFGRRATYFYGGSSTSHREVMAPYLLHFEIMRHARARGIKWYDFYGVSPAEDSTHRWANISVFKRKFGGIEKRFVETLDRVYDPSAYESYRRRKHRNRTEPPAAG